MKALAPATTAIRLLGALAALLLAAQLNSAHAVTVDGTSILPGAVSYEYFGLNFANNIQESHTVGTLNYGSGPGCGGTCIATTHLGSSPFVSATVNEVLYGNTGGGGVKASLGYYMAYINAPGNYNVNLHATDTLSAPDGASVSAGLAFGPAADNTSRFNNFANRDFQEADCKNGCPAPGFVVPAAPFVPDHLLSLTANTLYYLQLDVLLNPLFGDGVEISGLIDPTFSTSASGGQFLFSPGVFSLVATTPIPATLPLFASCLAALGAVGWRRKKAATAA